MLKRATQQVRSAQRPVTRTGLRQLLALSLTAAARVPQSQSPPALIQSRAFASLPVQPFYPFPGAILESPRLCPKLRDKLDSATTRPQRMQPPAIISLSDRPDLGKSTNKTLNPIRS